MLHFFTILFLQIPEKNELLTDVTPVNYLWNEPCLSANRHWDILSSDGKVPAR